MIAFPLTRTNRLRLARAFAGHRRIDLGIECALEDQLGQAFVDNLAEPAVFRIAQGSFSYLAGEPAHPAAGALLAALPSWTLLLDLAPPWVTLARAVLGTRLGDMTRYEFDAAGLNRATLSGFAGVARDAQVLTLDGAMREHGAALPEWFSLDPFDSLADFLERGLGFVAWSDGAIRGAAWSSLICSRGVEVSIYVAEPFRRRGLATALGASLALASLERGLIPHWDAANVPSCGLAEKLGYRPVGSYTGYFITA